MNLKKIYTFILDYPKVFSIILLASIFIIKNSFSYNNGVSWKKNDYSIPALKREKANFTKGIQIDSAIFNSLIFKGKYDSLNRKTGYWIELDKRMDSTIKGFKVHIGKHIDTMGTREFIILSEGIFNNGKKNGIWFVYIQHPIQDKKWVKIFDIVYYNGDTIKKTDFRIPLIKPWEAKPSLTYPSNNPIFDYEREIYFKKLNPKRNIDNSY